MANNCSLNKASRLLALATLNQNSNQGYLAKEYFTLKYEKKTQFELL